MKLSQSQCYAVAVAAGLPDPKLMAAIAMAESSGDTNVVNSIGCVGLWQINQPVHVKANPRWTVKWLQNPLNNAIAAKAILKSQGLGAWEVYTGPDGKGSDGPYKDHINQPIDTSVTTAGWLDPLDIIPDGIDVIPSLPGMDALDAVGDALDRTADVLVNPQTWLRLAYGITGVVLIVGGLLLIVKNSSVVKQANENVKAVAGMMPQAKAGKAAGAAKAGKAAGATKAGKAAGVTKSAAKTGA